MSEESTTKFNPGDRVRITRDGASGAGVKAGDEGTVMDVADIWQAPVVFVMPDIWRDEVNGTTSRNDGKHTWALSPEYLIPVFTSAERRQDMNRVLMEVLDETEAQYAKWGEQNHPDAHPHEDIATLTRALSRALALEWKTTNDRRVKNQVLGWDGILLEEVHEALAEEDPAKLRAELIQVAAVAATWIAAIDRRTLRGIAHGHDEEAA